VLRIGQSERVTGRVRKDDEPTIASPLKRLVAWAVDAVLVMVLFWCALWAFAWLHDPLLIFLGALLVTASYMLFNQSVGVGRWGATPGMVLVGVRVVDAETNEPCGSRRALWRALSLIPFVVVPYGYEAAQAANAGVVVSRTDRRSARDLFAGTKVVRRSPRRPLHRASHPYARRGPGRAVTAEKESRPSGPLSRLSRWLRT
jgi:uncharacterized RDD family membrane protein YckC